jgi:hypothetical protein
MNSWDDYAAALGELPAWRQYALQLTFADMVATALQMLRYGVKYRIMD